MRLRLFLAALVSVASPLRAQQSGLLLGVRNEGEYRTYWITPGDRRFFTGHDLIVPGRDGFFRVCTVPYHELSDGELSVADSVAVTPADATRGVCGTGDSVDEAEETAARCSSHSESKVTFAGPAALSITYDGEFTCGMHPSGESRVLLRRLSGDTIAFEMALDSTMRAKWRGHASRAVQKQYGDFGILDEGTLEDNRAHLSIEDAIGIERGRGQWQSTSSVSCSPHVACGTTSLPLSVPGFALPRSLVGHDVLRPALSVITKRFLQAKDAFSSPSGDVVGVVDADTLRIFAPKGRALGAPIMSIPFQGEIVMIEWATGRFVARWTRELEPLLASP